MRLYFGVPRLLLVLLAASISNSGLVSQLAHAEVVDAEYFLAAPDYLQARLAPNGEYLAVTALTSERGTLKIYNTETMHLTMSFQTKRRYLIDSFTWINNETLVFSHAFTDGNHDVPQRAGELFTLNIHTKKSKIIAGQNLFDRAAYFLIDVLPAEPKLIAVVRKKIISNSIANSKPAVKFLKFNRAHGNPLLPKRSIRSPYENGGFFTDNDGDVRLAYAFNKHGQALMSHRSKGSKQWYELTLASDETSSKLPDFSPLFVGFSGDNNSFYFLAVGKHGTLAVKRHYLLEKLTETVYEHPTFDIDSGKIIRSRKGVPIGAYLMFPKPEAVFFSEHEDVQLLKKLIKTFPDQQVLFSDSSVDGKTSLVDVRGDQNSGTLFLYRDDTQKLSGLLKARIGHKPEVFSKRRAFAIKAEDGKVLYGFTTLPVGRQPEALPTVVLIHGGPFGTSDGYLFNAEAQLLANRGYAVIQINFRGSSGFGVAFQDSGIGNWGSGMISDINDAAKWAIQTGIADPKKLCVMGTSYGGYGALMATIRAPELYRCAITIAGISDLDLMYKSDIPSVFFGKAYLDVALGISPGDREQNSPLHLVDNIKVPVFIAHGGNDRRAIPANAKLLRKALEDKQLPHEWLYKPGEGHGFYQLAHRIELYQKIDDFLRKAFND